MGAALSSAAPRWGLTFGDYTRLGYGRFALTDVKLAQPAFRATAKRVEADSPLPWLWGGLTGDGGVVAIEGWQVEVQPTEETAPAAGQKDGPTGWMPLRSQLRDVAAQAERWIARATLGPGVMRWPDGELTLDGATWHERTLELEQLAYQDRTIDATLAIPAAVDEIRLTAQTDDDEGSVALVSRGPRLSGEVEWWEQRATLAAQFEPHGWIPRSAELMTEEWNLPAEKLELGHLYARISGQGRVEWSNQIFDVDVTARSAPLPDTQTPPLDVALRGRGDLTAVTIEEFHADIPGANARLTTPVTIERSGKFRDAPAVLTTQVDLSRLPWIAASGRVEGEAKLVAGISASPVVEFEITGQDVAAEGVALESANAQGLLEWPRVHLTTATIVGRDGERLRASGGWDFRAKEAMDVTIAGELRRATFARWVPETLQFTTVTVNAVVDGPVAEMEHRGAVKADGISMGEVKPIDASITWRGAGLRADHVAASLVAGETRLALEGSVDRERARLTAFEFRPRGAPALQLEEPAVFQWKPSLRIESLHLEGPDSAIDANLNWGVAGRISIALRGISSGWFADFVELPGPAWTLSSVAVTGTWDDGPMTFEAVASAQAELRQGRAAQINATLEGDGRGVRITALRATEAEEAVVNATGEIPVLITPGATELWQIDSDGALALHATMADNAAFWDQLGSLTGLNLTAPRMAAEISGTWRQPKGTVRVSAERVALDPQRSKRELPVIDDLAVALTGNRQGVTLERFALRIEDQPVRGSGRLPFPDTDWSALRENPLAFLRSGADLQLEVPSAQIEAFAEMLPDMVVPQGTIDVRVTFRDGALGGGLRLSNAATRPVGSLGRLHDINADVRLDGDVVQLHSISAELGGAKVRVSGRMVLPPLESFRDRAGSPPLPQFDVAVTGRNLPLVRRMGLLVRADLDLELNSPENAVPIVSGTVRLRDSLFLQDVRALIPSGTRSKTARPPYFAVEIEPFESWQLDVGVTGDEFMRLRTTLFSGTASAEFQIGGTLGEPMMLGEATVDRGKVKLPFATFEVQDGRVWLTAAQPHEPQIEVTATTRRYEYDLRMEVKGDASSPALHFESTPSLEHGQVLLMVMAGVVPNEGVTVTATQRATRLGTYLGRSLLSGLGDADDTSRLTITSGEDISEQGRETFEIEYALDDRWALTAEHDEYDSQSLGVKWEAYARGGSFKDERPEDEPGAPTGRESAAAATAAEEEREPAKIDVSGLGWFSNLQMEASLKRLLGEAHEPVLDVHTIEDAVFLLLSAVQEDGYLRPVARIRVTNTDGTEQSFTVGADLATRLPREVAARRVELEVERGTRYVVDELQISGLSALEEDTARSYFVGEPGLFKRKAARRYTPDRLKRGVASLEAALRERGFADAKVAAGEPRIDHETGRVALAVEVDEGPRWKIADLAVEGERGELIEEATLAAFVGEPWSGSVEQDIAAEIRKLHLEDGYADVRVRISHVTSPAGEGAQNVAVTARVEPGPQVTIGDVRFEGNVKTQDSVLRRRVRAEPGDPLNLIDLQEARHRIAGLSIFEEVDLAVEPGEGRVRDAVFVLEPGRQMEVNLLAGYNTYELLRAGVEVRRYNVWGRAHQTRALLVQSMKSTRGEYLYTVPELFGESVTGTARLFGLQRDEVAFLREEFGASFMVDTPLSFLGANATAGYSFQVLRNRDNELATRVQDNRQLDVASIEGGLTRDRRDNPLLPRDGYRWFSRFEAASPVLGGNAEYQRTEFGGTYHKSSGRGRWLHFAAAHGVVTTFGTTDENLPVNRRFFPGGDGSIRGYNVGEAAPRGADGRFVGAKSYLSAAVEFEQAIAAQWSAVLFVDLLGTARQLAQYPFDETLAAVGLGVRYQTLIGPVRAEYGYNLKRRDGDPSGTFLLSIGFPF